MQTIGAILIILVISLYVAWIIYTKNQSGIVAKEEGDIQVFEVLVKGVYSPSVLRSKVGRPVRINFKREESAECSRYVNFPYFKIRKELPDGEIVAVEFTPERKGEFIFTCDMSMYQGKLIVV